MKNTQENNATKAERILRAAYSAWNNSAELRRVRNRNKNFTYGRQWNDLTTDIDGNPITEGQKIRETGKSLSPTI